MLIRPNKLIFAFSFSSYAILSFIKATTVSLVQELTSYHQQLVTLMGSFPILYLILKRYSGENQRQVISILTNILEGDDDESRIFWNRTRDDIEACVSMAQCSSALLVAAVQSDKLATEFLLTDHPHGLRYDYNVMDEYGWTAIHYAAWLDLADFLSLLVSKGADPSLLSPEGFTALHIAAIRGFDVSTRSLLNVILESYGESAVCEFMNIQFKHATASTAFDIASIPPTKHLVLDAIREFHSACSCDFPLDEAVVKVISQKFKDTSLNVQCFDAKNKKYYAVDSTIVEKRGRNIDVMESSSISSDAFASMYFRLHRPVLITGNMTNNFGLWKYLSNMSMFIERYGDIPVKTGWIPYPEFYGNDTAKEMSIKEFLFEGFDASTVPSNFSMEWQVKQARIAFDASVFAKNKLLIEDLGSHPVFEDICRSKSGRRGRNERTFLNNAQLSIGPTFSGAPLHSHVAAWNVVFQGVKKWLLFPPGTLRNRSTRLDFSDAYYSTFPIDQGWGLGSKISVEEAERAVSHGLGFEVLQFPGEVLFIPSNWGHATLNLCGTISIAQEFGCLDDGTHKRLLKLPVMQTYAPIFTRKSGILGSVS